MTSTVWEAVKLNVWLAWVSSTKVADVVVTAVDEVTTYLLLNVNRVVELAAGLIETPPTDQWLLAVLPTVHDIVTVGAAPASVLPDPLVLLIVMFQRSV